MYKKKKKLTKAEKSPKHEIKKKKEKPLEKNEKKLTELDAGQPI